MGFWASPDASLSCTEAREKDPRRGWWAREINDTTVQPRAPNMDDQKQSRRPDTEKDVSGAPRARGCNAQPRDTARNHARLHPGNPNALTHTRHTPQSTHAYVIIDCGAHAASQLGAGARPQPRPRTHPSDTPAEGNRGALRRRRRRGLKLTAPRGVARLRPASL